MSEKKSWDVVRAPSRPARKPAPDVVLVGRVAPRKGPPQNLRRRRRRRRARAAILLLIVLLMVIGGIFYLLWQPFMRVQGINADGPDAAAVKDAAQAALAGTYFHILPRDSIAFVPKAAIRNAVLAADTDIAAISVSRASLDSLSLEIIPRASAFWWCGAVRASSADAAGGSCYQADADGFIFAAASPAGADPLASSTALSSAPDGELLIYGPLATTSPSVLGKTVADATAIPGALRFARALDTLDADAVSIQLRGDEADVYLASGTRVTYVLGDEQAAADAAAAAFPQLDLRDGSVDYVDLRFDGKVYVKNRDGTATQASQ